MNAPQPVSSPAFNITMMQMHNDLPQTDYDYKKLIEGLPAAIYVCDMEGRITFYNEASAELWGRRPVIGKDLWCGSWKIYRPDGSPMKLDECPMAIALKEGRPVKGVEIVVERPDGVRLNVLPHPKPICNSYGKIIGAVNMLVDITARRKAEEEIRKSEEEYRLLSESLAKKVEERTSVLQKSEERYHKMIGEVQDYAILLLDKNGTILNWNKGAEKIKGYTEEEIVGKNFRTFYLEEDRLSKLPERLIKKAMDEGKAMQEGWRLRKDGNKFWGSIVITALHDEHNNIIGFSKVTRDLTERKLADDQLKQYARELEFQNRELEQFAYVASHDLQEPLRKIATFSELLERNIHDEAAARRNADRINAAAKKMITLVRDVLKYSQLSKTDELFTQIDLQEVLRNAEENFDLLIEEKKVKIKHGKLPVIKGISIQLQQLFSNLISNAIKFSSANPVIEITCEKPTKHELKRMPQLNDNYVKIVFKDNGIGFEPQYAEQVFKLFQRLDYNRSGTGIGLALCKKIVENHDGFIYVSSEQNK